jgi:hypothetical protein
MTTIKYYTFDELMHFSKQWRIKDGYKSIPNLVKNKSYKPVLDKVILIQEEGTCGILKNQISYV